MMIEREEGQREGDVQGDRDTEQLHSLERVHPTLFPVPELTIGLVARSNPLPSFSSKCYLLYIFFLPLIHYKFHLQVYLEVLFLFSILLILCSANSLSSERILDSHRSKNRIENSHCPLPSLP